jgi:hypothetical protein
VVARYSVQGKSAAQLRESGHPWRTCTAHRQCRSAAAPLNHNTCRHWRLAPSPTKVRCRRRWQHLRQHAQRLNRLLRQAQYLPQFPRQRLRQSSDWLYLAVTCRSVDWPTAGRWHHRPGTLQTFCQVRAILLHLARKAKLHSHQGPAIPEITRIFACMFPYYLSSYSVGGGVGTTFIQPLGHLST